MPLAEMSVAFSNAHSLIARAFNDPPAYRLLIRSKVKQVDGGPHHLPENSHANLYDSTHHSDFAPRRRAPQLGL